MTESNLEYLKNSLKYLGFGDNLNKDLEQQMREGADKFKLMMTGEFVKGDVKDGEKQNVSFNLDFSKSAKEDMYFLNKYDAVLKKPDPSHDVKQTFYLDKTGGVTAKEAFNLLSGRAVNKTFTPKEGDKYNAWVQLDFKEKDKHENYVTKKFGENYGYNLEDTLQKYPIKELLSDDERSKLIKSLEKGNLVSVTFNQEGKDEKMFISANPHYKSLHLYNSKMEYKYQERKASTDQKQDGPSKDSGKDKAKDQKESVKNNDEEGPAKKKPRKGIRV